jgi:hypothetical protein
MPRLPLGSAAYSRYVRTTVTVAALLVALTGCGTTEPTAPVASPTPSTAPLSTAPPSSAPAGTASPSSAAASPGTVPPPWLGTRALPLRADGFGEIRPTPKALRDRRFALPDRLPALPGTGFASRIVDPAPAKVLARSTWTPGCPVAAHDLTWVRLTFRGFDDERHTGELLVNHAVARDVVRVFADLYAARFPIEEMRITTKAEQTAPPTGDGNDTSSFNCRPVRGATSYSQHAYGLAVDVNPFQNPYLKGDLVLPELASAYRDRSWHRPGMVLPGGPVVRAFARIGWSWGGSWHSLKDLQHFSANGR